MTSMLPSKLVDSIVADVMLLGQVGASTVDGGTHGVVASASWGGVSHRRHRHRGQ